MRDLVLDIGERGQIEGLYDDSMPLSSLNSGEVSMSRASKIEWDDMKQRWYVSLMNGIIPHIVTKPNGFESYEEARNFEVRFLNKCREEDVDYYSTALQDKNRMYSLAGNILYLE